MSAVAHLFDLVEREAANRVGWLTVPQVREARAEVVALVEALRQSDEWVRAAKAQGCNLPCENTLANNRATLAKFQEVA